MPTQSKVKFSKQKQRLADRIQAWERIPIGDKTGKSGKLSMIRPGSMKK